MHCREKGVEVRQRGPGGAAPARAERRGSSSGRHRCHGCRRRAAARRRGGEKGAGAAGRFWALDLLTR